MVRSIKHKRTYCDKIAILKYNTYHLAKTDMQISLGITVQMKQFFFFFFFFFVKKRCD